MSLLYATVYVQLPPKTFGHFTLHYNKCHFFDILLYKQKDICKCGRSLQTYIVYECEYVFYISYYTQICYTVPCRMTSMTLRSSPTSLVTVHSK